MITYHIDWDNDGFGAGDNITEYVIDSDSKAGFSPTLLIDERVPPVGTLTLTLNNEDRRYSPENTTGPHYGKLVPGLPLKVVSGSTVIFYGETSAIIPRPGTFGGKTATVYAEDMLARLRDTKISLPLQENQTTDYLLKLITSAAWRSGQASAALQLRKIANNHTLTIGDRTYTFKSTLTPAADEIALGSRYVPVESDVYDAAVNLAAAINAETRSGTDYAAATERNVDITATGTMFITSDKSPSSQWNLLDNSGATNYEALCTSFTFGYSATLEPKSIMLGRVYLELRKVGNPNNTLTLRAETRGGVNFDRPSGTLENASAVATLAESSLTTDWAWYPFDFTEYECFSRRSDDTSTSTMSPHCLVLSSDRAASNTDYVQWRKTSSSSSRFRSNTKVAGTWSALNFTDAGLIMIGGDLELKAVARGAWGNLALAQTGDQIVLPGATMTGGTDGPVSMISYETGKSTIESAGQGWSPTETRALDAVTEVSVSEFGLFWAALDGTLTFKNRNWLFDRTTAASSATFNGSFTDMSGELSINDVINKIRVIYNPPNTLAAGVVAKSQGVVTVPGSWGQDYKNPADDIPAGGTTVITLPFIDPTTGDMIGAKDLTLPLVPTTDYTIYEQSNGTGVNYTNTDYMKISVAVRASGVEISFRNTAGGRLYVRGLQVRGLGIVAYEPTESAQNDIDSMDDYGIRPYSFALPLSSTGISALAANIAQYLINRYKTPTYRVKSILFDEQIVGGVDLTTLKIGDVITLSEPETCVNAQRFVILGIGHRIYPTRTQVSFTLYPLKTNTYWKLGDSTYGKLGSTTRLAI